MTPDKTKERMIPGPAPGRWASPTIAVPISTKIPVPMIAPMPSAVRSQAVSVFFSRWSGWSASDKICSIGLVRHSLAIIERIAIRVVTHGAESRAGDFIWLQV